MSSNRFLIQVTQLKTLEVEVEAPSHPEALDVAIDKARGGGYSFAECDLDFAVDYAFANVDVANEGEEGLGTSSV